MMLFALSTSISLFDRIFETGMLYDFLVTVSESKIPGAGLGAYLTYLGARALRSEKKAKYRQLLGESISVYSNMFDPLKARGEDGRTTLVRLTGEHLLSPFNCLYQPSTSIPLEARIPSDASASVFPRCSVNVKLSGQGIQFHHEMINRPENGIGFLGLNDNSDFISVPGRQFHLRSCIDLGAYGPLRLTGM